MPISCPRRALERLSVAHFREEGDVSPVLADIEKAELDMQRGSLERET